MMKRTGIILSILFIATGVAIHLTPSLNTSLVYAADGGAAEGGAADGGAADGGAADGGAADGGAADGGAAEVVLQTVAQLIETFQENVSR